MATSPDSPFDSSMQRIRDAAKWLIGAAAAVGAALIAGSQLSNIGQLPVGVRLVAAVAGVVVALVSVVIAIWVSVQILLPVGVTLTDLAEHWDADDRADVRFFQRYPRQLGYDSPAALIDARQKALAAQRAKPKKSGLFGRGTTPDAEAAQARVDEIDARIRTVLQTAQYEILKDEFGRVLRKLLAASAVAAVGIIVFAWAANPPKRPDVSTSLTNVDLSRADLRGADLKGVDLTGADLSNANLKGADLSGAVIRGVTWSHTICPDGTNSDDHDQTWRGHLTP